MTDKIFDYGQRVYILWFNDDDRIWEIDNENVYAGTIPLLKDKIAILQTDLPRIPKNLCFVNSRFVFTDLEKAYTEMQRLNALKR